MSRQGSHLKKESWNEVDRSESRFFFHGSTVAEKFAEKFPARIVSQYRNTQLNIFVKKESIQNLLLFLDRFLSDAFWFLIHLKFIWQF